MRIILIMSLFALSTLVAATDYYVSSSGNDSANGTSESTPWKTISKVNSSFSLIKPGDRVLFRCGDIFYGSLKITATGISGNPITIGSYGTGKKPVITGFTTISLWKNEGNGIYSKAVSCESAPEMVIINGVQYAMGRHPNSTWATVDSHSGDISITDADLNAGIVNWTGADLIQRKGCRFVMDRYRIASHSGSTLTYNGAGTYLPTDGWGYFIQNNIKTLDTFGEWYYSTSSSVFYMYFGTSNPENCIVQIATINNLISPSTNKHFLTFDNIALRGANANAVNCYLNNNITIQNCEIDFSGDSGIRGISSQYLYATNNTINHSNVSGIRIGGYYCHYCQIKGNIISNSGTIPGAGNFYKCGTAISHVQGDNLLVENNQVFNAGYCGITFSGSGTIIRNNLINTFCTMLEDGAAIFYASGTEGKNMLIQDNIILYGVGAVGGKPAGSASMAGGIYLDRGTTGGAKILNNTVAHCTWNGIYLHSSQNVDILNNTVFNCRSCSKFQEYTGINTPTRNVTMTGNIFFAKDPSHIPMFIMSLTNDFNQFGYFDNNYYARPLNNAKPILPSINWSGTPKTVPEWQALSGQDPNSKISPVILKDTTDIDFYYNSTNTNKVYALTKPMVDVKGTKYPNSVTLAPYRSVILMVDPDPAQAAIPVYVSSVIKNATPSLIEITYSETLAGIVPAVTAFTVMLNGVKKEISGVSVSGSKVLLTLASPVKYGTTIVTVSYTKPATNPLQSALGGVAEDLSPQTVTNQVIYSGTAVTEPVYVNSVVENTSPDIIEIYYDIDLAGIVPDISAFSIWYNSVAKTIQSVAVSGNKVLLTLPAPIKYGTTLITVAYTKPANNPLQSTSGGLAATLAPQVVTNKVITTGAVIPLYVNSVIQSMTPDVIEMNYDADLANIIPDISAFSLWYNSVPKSIASVRISGKRVLLTLPSPVIYGTTLITVAYNKPASNPLQSTSGGFAETLSPQIVTNNITLTKSARSSASIFNSEITAWSGFVYEIDASDYFSADYRNLTCIWSVPDNIPAYSTDDTKIQFLTPVVQEDKIIEFELTVSDGIFKESTGIPVFVKPYKPELEQIRIIETHASNYYQKDHPRNINDGYAETKWSARGDNQSLLLKLTSASRISHFQIAFLPDQKYKSFFDVFASKDNIRWEPVLIKTSSCSFSGDFQVFDLPSASSETEYSYIRFVGHGNSVNDWNSVSELRIYGWPGLFGSDLTGNTDLISLYPNPVRDHINIQLGSSYEELLMLRVYDKLGRICHEERIDPGVISLQMPVNLAPGSYGVQILKGSTVILSQNIIVCK